MLEHPFFFFLNNSIEGSQSKVTKLSSQSDGVTDGDKSKTSSLTVFFNPFSTNAPFLYSLETCFQGV